jgi:hypothetical protein
VRLSAKWVPWQDGICHMTGDRDIKWTCSHCGATFPTREALTAHVAVNHEGHPFEDAPRQERARPGVSANESELPPNELRYGDAGLARRSEPAAAAVPADENIKSAAAPTPQTHRRTALRTLGWIAVATVCIVVAGLVIAFPHQVAHQISLSVTTQPTPLTELYFSDPNGLPTSLSLSHPNLFGFTVVNHEGHDTVYSYGVTLASSHGTSTIARGRIDLRDNEGATRIVNVRPIRRATQYLITVHLFARSESIWFRGVSR